MKTDVFQAATGASPSRALLYAPLASAAMAEFSIAATIARQAAFLAQCAHETLGFALMAEVWGPTDAQMRYEPPADLAARLGNTAPGDGKRFKGRGPIQITGRFNYGKFGAKLGMDLLTFPQLLDEPVNAWRASAAFWFDRGLNELADAGDFLAITKRINGGTNGLADRQLRWEKAKAVLTVALA